jgi:outer membrane receptor protein involved in Fe transport
VNAYFITNLVISTNKLFNGRVSASLSIRNLFNQTYYDPGIRTADGNFYPTVNDQPGINGLFKISLSLF